MQRAPKTKDFVTLQAGVKVTYRLKYSKSGRMGLYQQSSGTSKRFQKEKLCIARKEKVQKI